ncbi:SIMPL domain-containing protein [Herbiconiux sp. KACC 21604]|uniref:SIMPL domain-containing protein n=1 Tax=unclassified Herbiconiux TaxID=2618217 RepID=UPI001492DF86|nr:SIMPL domain-containing protein [Herbiconiux sp. SALV-R1]QJU53834.1 SIMPL domain-containing protein [Herbiconiux sp. SALV-R1]WPO84845.1 SIMPL domain-containing protein [Herbiconiux sp. KACC 21604]
MPDTIITVSGSNEQHHNPELAVVRIGVGFEGSKRDSVLAATRAAHESLTGSLESLRDEDHGPVRVWHSEDIRVWGQRPWSQDNQRLPVEFHSAVFVDAEFDDFEALSEWIDVVAVREGIAVDGITWSLAPETDAVVRAEARRAAVADAVAKAEEYAAALGLDEISPVSIADAGLLDDARGAGGGGQAPRAMALMAKSAPTPGGIELRPATIVVEASVHARFVASRASGTPARSTADTGTPGTTGTAATDTPAAR